MLKTAETAGQGGADSIRLRAIAGTQHEFFPILPEVGDAQSVAAPYIPISPRRCGDPPRIRRAEFGTLHGHAGKSQQNRSQGLASRSAKVPRHADAIVLVRRRHLPIHAGFRGCRPRMDVPAIGIIHARPGSLMRTSGQGRTQGHRPMRTGRRSGSSMGWLRASPFRVPTYTSDHKR